MANNPHFSVASRNAMLDQITSQIGSSGIFNIYQGDQPTDVSVAVSVGNAVVAAPTMTASSAFAPATGGVITANTITADSSAVGGTAIWFSICQSDGTTRVVDGSIGTSGADLNLNSVNVSTGASFSITAFTVTQAA